LNRHRQPPGGALSPGTAVAALAAEQTARTKAERSLQEALATIRDMQTKYGHAELARREAADAARAEQETVDALRAEQIARLREELAAERVARAAAEAERDEAIAARLRIERELQAALIAKAPPPAEARPAPTPRTRKIAPAARTPEPQPVKWWLKSGAKR